VISLRKTVILSTNWESEGLKNMARIVKRIRKARLTIHNCIECPFVILDRSTKSTDHLCTVYEEEDDGLPKSTDGNIPDWCPLEDKTESKV
jgi:hypothetical protein